MGSVNIPFEIRETEGIARATTAFRVGVPFARGTCPSVERLTVAGPGGKLLPAQFKVLARWPDRSVKWAVVDAISALGANESRVLSVRELAPEATLTVAQNPSVTVNQQGEIFEVATGGARFRIDAGAIGPFQSVVVGGRELLERGAEIVLTGLDGSRFDCRVDRRIVEEAGPTRACLLTEGAFVQGPRSLRFSTRTVFYAGSSSVRFEMKLLNPHVAHHHGGQWDLGDPGSYHFKDLSVRLLPAGRVKSLQWQAQPGEAPRSQSTPASWVLYQDSSGGASWDSDNHVDAAGQSTVAFRGYEVRAAGAVAEKGDRATPIVAVETEAGCIAATVEDFWQNFPKALRWDAGALAVALFPGESKGGFELQGGEQKRHAVLFDFAASSDAAELSALHAPPLVHVDASWLAQSGALSSFADVLDASSAAYAAYVGQVVDGPNSFFAKREVIDEYGWRNFGDLYADHEAVKHKGPKPLVSHYNNQYDFIYGAYLLFQRTGDVRWRRLMQDLARHVMDIDVYHTNEDKSAFSGGLFWHTDHYKPALTSTHRTYSGRNANGGDYGGGPSNEHNYTSGLLHYYYLTGDDEARQTVVGLADWVMQMDDGSGTLLGLFDEGPTGLASGTVTPDFHKLGRGAGNSINALLDAYAVSRDRRYVQKAEQLIQRCAHPLDDIAALGLLEPEYRWSYLVFLQMLGKYLDQKREWGELDYHYYYARDTLLHYGRWVASYEVPYKDVLHKVEIPTETWPAHDVRKCHVLYLTAKYAPEAERNALRTRAAFFFERCIADVVSFETAYLTRPLVILSVYGGIHAYYQQHAAGVPYVEHDYAFGRPTEFVPQRGRFKTTFKRKGAVAMNELRRVARDKLRGLKNRMSRS